jgi:SpoVK/Ycf46/Vps4 family AAA+-type ATPase
MDGPDQLTLLFHGLPGTGKTELAKHLAEQCRRKLQVERMSDLLSKWVGESEQNIAGAFRRAADAGNILLLDEFDSLAYDRGKAQHSWEISQTNELLQQIENFPGVLIASTNRLDSLDDAIYRRFSHKLGFLGIRRERRVEATAQYFQELLGPDGLTSAHERRLLALPSLHPGDFRAVWQQLSAQMLEGSAVTADALVTALEHEASFRRDGGPRIGFGRQ